MNKEFKVDKEFFRKWVKALRSGKYLQITGALKRETKDGKVGYCCLGVACLVKAKITKKGQGKYANNCDGNLRYDNGDIVEDKGYAGNWLLPYKEQVTLAGMNDQVENPPGFLGIADYIERTYL